MMMATSTRSALARTSQAYYAQLGQTESLDWGIAFTSTAFPELGSANQFREVIISDPGQLIDAYDEVERYFAQRGLRCRRWAPAVDFDPEVIKPGLAEKGFREVVHHVMRLDHWHGQHKGHSDVRVLPARPMQQAFRSTFDASCLAPGDGLERWVESEIERLDNASLEMFVAMLDKQPVGRVGLFLVGDIARVVGPYVSPECRRRGIGDALLHHVLVLGQRLAPRIICTEFPVSSSSARQLFERSGFSVDGQWVEFHRP